METTTPHLTQRGFTPYHFFYVYVLQSVKKTSELYIGVTANLRKRLNEHNSGRSASTKRYMPWQLVYYEAFSDHTLAVNRESRLKNNGNSMIELKKRIGKATLVKSGKGFTLVEMLVVIAIMVILTAVVINGQTGFNKSILVTDVSYTIALSLRQAQTYGLSSRTFSNVNNAGYGIHFASASPKQYSMFADLQGGGQPTWCPTTQTGQADDKPGNCLYDTATEVVQSFTLDRGFYISRICGHSFQQPATLLCSTDSMPLTLMDIIFLRPNTDTIITGRVNNTNVQLSDASIVISDPSGAGTRLVCVSHAGQISVASTVCP